MTKSFAMKVFSATCIPLAVTLLASGIIFSGREINTGVTIAANCSAEKIAEIVAPATASENTVNIDCNLTLKGTETITKTMVFKGAAATGVVVDCNGARLNGAKGTVNADNAMIMVTSRKKDNNISWERPENITIKNCKVDGSVKIAGMNVRGETAKPGYVETARSSAPKNITLDHITINSHGNIPLYIYPGVTYFSLLNSEISGTSNSVAVYLDAETYGNTFINNKIQATTSREVIAIDGSSHNTITKNWFSGLSKGGIFLYRNCGERGEIRHSTPSYNSIINNIFYYKDYSGVYYINNIMLGHPTIYIGSRNGDDAGAGYCDDDKGYPFGSSASDLDYARYNVVMQNRLYKLNPDLNITGRNKELNSPNFIAYNEKVSSATARPSGCYLSEDGYKTNFIADGASAEVLEIAGGEPVSYNYRCNDGKLTRTGQNSKVSKLIFECRASSNNAGCNKTIACPTGQKIIGASAAANLEDGLVTDDQFNNVTTNTIQVFVPSDNTDEGSAFIGNIKLQKGVAYITGIDGLSSIPIGCKEHDANGGDCHLKVALFCR